MGSRSFIHLVVAASLAAGCAPAPEAPDPAAPQGTAAVSTASTWIPPIRVSSRGPQARLSDRQRPQTIRARPFDYGSLPIVKRAPGGVSPPASVALRVVETGLVVDAPTGVIAQALVQGVILPSASPSEKRLPSSPTCKVEDVSWETITLSSWTDASLDYASFNGRMAPTCRAAGNEVARIQATAVVPSVVYAFRECLGECLPGGEEILVLLGPPSAWAVSSAPWPSDQLQRQSGSFSKVRVPLKKGGSATAAITVSYAGLGKFVSLHRPVTAPREAAPAGPLEISFEIEAIWPAGDAAPSGMVVTSSSARSAADMLQAIGVPP